MLIPLSNVPRDYAWGSTALLARLEGRDPSGSPEAEVWFGDHAADPADLPDGRTLRDVTGGTLPYLLKLLAADAPLSIQAHPSKAQAEEGFAREATLAFDDPRRNYRDDNHKPELLVALSERFDALVGLRPVADTLRLLAGLGDGAGVRALRDRLTAPGDALRAAVSWALSEATEVEIEQIHTAIAEAQVPEFDAALTAVRRAAALNPADRGVVVALLMNHVALAPGEAVFLPAGVLHAYQGGLGVEIMAASDNVLRGGLTGKHIDVAELLTVLDTAAPEVRVQQPGQVPDATYHAPVADFALRRLRLGPAEVSLEVSGPVIVLVTAGEVAVTADAETVAVVPGRAVFAQDVEELRITGPGEAFIAQQPRR